MMSWKCFCKFTNKKRIIHNKSLNLFRPGESIINSLTSIIITLEKNLYLCPLLLTDCKNLINLCWQMRKNVTLVLLFLFINITVGFAQKTHHWETAIFKNDTWRYFIGTTDRALIQHPTGVRSPSPIPAGLRVKEALVGATATMAQP